MATIFGALGLQDNDYITPAYERRVYDTINEYATRTETELDDAFSVFVERETEDYTEKYFLPSGGMMQDSAELTRPGAVKPIGEWDVAFPLRSARDQLAWTRESAAYTTAAKLDAQVKGVANRYLNWKRFHILKALLNKTNETFSSNLHADITIRRLANGDGTNYPPLVGSTTEGEETHYIGSNYATSSISDTNNPIANIVKPELSEHFGTGRYIAFVNSAEVPKLSGLAIFDSKAPDWVRPGVGVDVASADGVRAPGSFVGAMADVAIFEWNWIPATFILGLNIDAPKPLIKRVDISAAAHLRGFKLVAQQEEYPLQESYWEAREGYGVGNRLNGVAVNTIASTTYANPSAYA